MMYLSFVALVFIVCILCYIVFLPYQVMLWACRPQSCLFVQVLDIVIIAKDEEARPLNLNITNRKEA
jgi:hypothetical protein